MMRKQIAVLLSVVLLAAADVRSSGSTEREMRNTSETETVIGDTAEAELSPAQESRSIPLASLSEQEETLSSESVPSSESIPLPESVPSESGSEEPSGSESEEPSGSESEEPVFESEKIELGSTYTGELTAVKTQEYQFELERSGSVSLALTGQIAESQVALYDEFGNCIEQAACRVSDQAAAFQYDLCIGGYRLVLKGTANTVKGAYTLETGSREIEESFPESLTDNNDTEDSASILSLNKSYTGLMASNENYDIYKVSIPRSGQIVLNLSGSFSGLNYMIREVNTLETVCCGNIYRSEASFAEKKPLDINQGFYYIVLEKENNAHGAYLFDIQYTASYESFREGHNGNYNDIASSRAISIARSYRAQLSANDKTDCVRFMISSRRIIDLHFAAQTRMMCVEIYNENGSCVFRKTPFDSSNNIYDVYEITLAAGLYYLKFSCEQGYTGNYQYTIRPHAEALVAVTPQSLKMQEGISRTVSITGKNILPSVKADYTCDTADPTIADYRWIDDTHFIVTGLKAGITQITVTLSDFYTQKVLAQTQMTITVVAAPTPTVRALPGTVKLAAGAEKAVRILSSNLPANAGNPGYSVRTENGDYSVVDFYWQENDDDILVITGESAGTAAVIVDLVDRDNDTVLATVKIPVTVVLKADIIETIKHTDLYYSFANYGYSDIPLSICQYMYGENAKAQYAYKSNLGQAGVCFGMAATSNLFYQTGNGIETADFLEGTKRIADLAVDNFSETYGLSVGDFVAALQVSQLAPALYYKKSENSGQSLTEKIGKIKEQLDQGNPVQLSVRGTIGSSVSGHALLAYRWNEDDAQTERIYVYDSNYPFQEKSILLKKNDGVYTEWSYFINPQTQWGTSQAGNYISYLTYDDIYSAWQQRGRLGEEGDGLLCCSIQSYTVYNEAGELAAEVRNGIVFSLGNGITEVYPDDCKDALFLSVPGDQSYTVVSENDAEVMELTLAGNNSVVILRAQCAEASISAGKSAGNTVTVSPMAGTKYSVSIKVSGGTEPEEAEVEGTGAGEEIFVGEYDGRLKTRNIGEARISVDGVAAEPSL